MANKLVYEVGVSTPEIKLKRAIILFLLGIICLTLIEASPVEVERHSFENPPVRTFVYFKESDNVLYLDYSANVWISSDAGANWELISGVPRNVAAALIEHSFSNDRAYIITNEKKHYKTSDKGKTWQEFTIPVAAARNVPILSFHAHREDRLLFRGIECAHLFECTDITYYTTDDFGSTKKLLENTDRCIWAHNSVKFDDAPISSIFCIQYDVTGSGSTRKLSDYRLVESEDYFETTNIVDFSTGGDVRGVIGLGESQSYLVAAVKDPNSLEMKMYVTVDGQKWARAFFPLNKGPKEAAYTVLESPTDHLVVDVLDTKHSTGSLFVSNSNGTYFINRLKHTNRNKLGLSDFKLSNVGGHFLANIVSNFEEINDIDDKRKKLQTKISFDDGVTWKFIKPPEKNIDDTTEFLCRGDWKEGKCSLHLHLVTTARNNGHMFSSSAPGVLMGVGNVGEYLLPYEQCDTFLSYDGGLTWKVVKLGAHMFGIGHYGSILVIIDDEQPTDYILYSYDRGEHWYKKELGTKIRAKLLTTDFNSKSKTFLLLGSAVPDHDTPDDGSGNYRHFTFRLDFSNLFGRDCNRDEFDDWFLIRSGSDVNSDCFMGKKTTYHRRKADAQCFVSKLPDPNDEECACTKRDYECDSNYVFDKDEEKCIPLVPERIPDGECENGRKTYLGSSGFRLIPGNGCNSDREGSVKHEPVERECNSSPIYGDVTHRTANFAIMNYFYFPESQVLMILTIDGKVKRSDDEGTTWNDVLLDAGPIAYMYKHDHDNYRAYFFPNNKADNEYYMWYTTDRGENFDRTRLENEPNKLNIRLLDFHPKQPDWLLFMASTSCPGCNSITYFSSDNGKSWKEIETWADKCMFGKDTEFSETGDDVIFCSSYKFKNSNIPQDELGGRTSEANPLQLIKMKTNGESKNVLLSDVVTFFIFNEFMAVATEDHGQLLLHTSTNGLEFANATFPPHLSVKKQAFTLLPSATGSIFLDTYKSLRFGYGSLFKSNSKGTFFNRILDNTNRNIYGNVDFEKVAGLDGIIIANQVENVDELDGFGEFAEKKIITQISHDDGSRWKRLKIEGREDCQDDCYLNLHGRTDVYVPDNIFSAPSTVGLLIGVGNVGRYLLPYNECNTYMSRDGGRTWKEIRRGASLYEFGDQGTIIVVVDNKGPTDHVRYSWDYGKNWERYQFTSTPVRAIFLTANLNTTSMKFLLYGYTTREASPVLVTIDFSQLEKRKCEKDDLELWDPMDEHSDDHKCLLGEWREYWRRKEDRKCKIGFKLEAGEPKTCKCTKHDFDCADGYWRNAKGDCELMGPDPDRPANCRNKYSGHSGYVKMRKTKCEGGDNLDKKIDKACNSGNIIISKTSVFDHRIIESFYLNKSRTILARTTDNIVWRGIDEGHTWEVPAELQNEKVYSILPNPYFNEYAYCITREKIFYTSDSGNSFKEIPVKMNPNNLQLPILNFHPDKPEYLIYTGSEGCENIFSPNCYTEVFYTLDNGKNWKSLEKYVRQCQWARNKKFRLSDEKLIICESYRDKEGSQLSFYNNPLQLVSISSFKNKDLIFPNIVGAAMFEEFMIVAELLPSGQSLRLSVSIDAKTFAEAQFPPNIPIIQEAYTVLQSTTHSIILHVTTSSIKSRNKYGSILKSNGNGTYYSLSLGGANRDDIGYVDFEKMQGIQGIALANVVNNIYEADMGSDKELKTMITFNDGSTWNLLKRPDTDSNGHKYNCHGGNSDDKCSLHLHSYTERRNPRDSFSSPSATGLMMGVGNVGAYLTPYLEGDTFLTRDAGLSWIEVKKGAYMYEFGNQGGILILVDDEHPTDHVLYSLNEGLEWQEYKFTKIGEQAIRVTDIDIMPGGLSSKFILRGVNPSRNTEEVVVHLDFSEVFTRNCNLNDDFEKWSPHLPDECIFGHKITYLRKNQTKECFIDENLRDKKERGEDCDCTDRDFECDYNYIRNATGQCTLFPGAQPIFRDVAEQCANNQYWYELTGYRKLESSTCKGGPKSHPCPSRHSVLFWIIIVLLPFIIVGILTICFINRRHGGGYGRIQLGSSIEPNSILSSIVDIFYQIRMPRFVSRLWSNIPLPGRRSRYHYSPVATDDGEVLMDDYDQDNETL